MSFVVIYLLHDVPQVTVVGESQQPVGGGHGMERRRLLVSEERVRHPDLVPTEVRQLHLRDDVILELETRVVPLLTQVEADGVILKREDSDVSARISSAV